jgi:hypothetical protein
MSTISSYDSALDFYPEAQAVKTTATATKGGKLVAKLRVLWEALAEGNAAAYRYRELISRGLTSDAAAAKVFAEFYTAR